MSSESGQASRFFPAFSSQTICTDDMMFVYWDWVSTRWQWSINVYKNKKEASIYRRRKNTQNNENHKIHKIEKKNKKQENRHNKNIER